jgi:acyl-CoA thioester hydrolase
MRCAAMASFPPPPSGILDGAVHRFAVRAYFEDTDLSGVVYHANYLRWFERARSDFVRLLGIDQRAANEAGEGAFAVVNLEIRYAAPARLDDTVIISTTCLALGGASCHMHQIAIRDDTLLADASLRVGFVAPDGRPRRMPEAWRAAFAPIVTEGNP